MLYVSQTAVLSCAIIVIILFAVPQTRSAVAYYVVVISVAVGFSLPVLTVFFRRNFIAWLADYIYTDATKVPYLVLAFYFWLFVGLTHCSSYYLI